MTWWTARKSSPVRPPRSMNMSPPSPPPLRNRPSLPTRFPRAWSSSPPASTSSTTASNASPGRVRKILELIVYGLIGFRREYSIPESTSKISLYLSRNRSYITCSRGICLVVGEFSDIRYLRSTPSKKSETLTP